MDLKTEFVILSVSDGTSMGAYVARPSSQTPRAGMLVFQEAFGVNAHIRDVTERFAMQGYLAIAPELFHRTGPGFEGSYTDFGAIMPHFQGLTDAGMEADVQAAFAWLQNTADSKAFPVGAVGYCMGGRVAYLADCIVPLACGISYYGGGIAPSQYFPSLLHRAKELQAPMLFFWGGLDQHITPEQTQAVTSALREAKKPFVNVEISYADHGFSCDARPQYNADATAQAWALTLAFLDTNFAAHNVAAGA
jgi:carboxymethylenebutenolidase